MCCEEQKLPYLGLNAPFGKYSLSNSCKGAPQLKKTLKQYSYA